MSKAKRHGFMPWWKLIRYKRKARKALRARDGDDCSHCGHKMRFEGLPNCGKAATIEHHLPISKGGTWALDNLRLCHVGCNRHLGNHAPEHKERMRLRRGLEIVKG